MVKTMGSDFDVELNIERDIDPERGIERVL
jgi:hypothetical protein